MLKTSDVEMVEGNTIPYDRQSKNNGTNHGFIDLRGHPELVDEIVESSLSQALKNLLTKLAEKNAPFFTLGCDAGVAEDSTKNDDERFVGMFYVQLMYSNYKQHSATKCFLDAQAFQKALEEKSEGHNWSASFRVSESQFNLDGHNRRTPSMIVNLWTNAEASESAIVSRDRLIEEFLEILLRARS